MERNHDDPYEYRIKITFLYFHCGDYHCSYLLLSWVLFLLLPSLSLLLILMYIIIIIIDDDDDDDPKSSTAARRPAEQMRSAG